MGTHNELRPWRKVFEKKGVQILEVPLLVWSSMNKPVNRTLSRILCPSDVIISARGMLICNTDEKVKAWLTLVLPIFFFDIDRGLLIGMSRNCNQQTKVSNVELYNDERK